ncbi:hypothetical protein BC834DRAFT_86653 [Gloeopeniophorella convolvens]|nr:hypothetical protein BC834DRAFT_86653 [Gloeopeniophorella convolvens]
MSTRQNKKRKGKLNRERTVTTLIDTQDKLTSQKLQQSPFVIVDSNLPQAVVSPSAFSAVSPSNSVCNPGPTTPSAPLPMSSSYTTFGYGTFSSTQQPRHSKPSLPPGQSDLETLERLKETIKNNQHEIFRATPRPAALASLYQGSFYSLSPSTPVSSVPPHPEQVPNPPSENLTPTYSGSSLGTISTSGSASDIQRAEASADLSGASAGDLGRGSNVLPPRGGPSNLILSVPSRDQNGSSPNGYPTKLSHTAEPFRPNHRIQSQPASSPAEDPPDIHRGAGNVTPKPDAGSSLQPAVDSPFVSRDFAHPEGADDDQPAQPQLQSPETRHPTTGHDRTPYPHVLSMDRNQPPPHEARPFDRDRDWERDRGRGRDRRWSLSEQRRSNYDRRPPDNDRRPPTEDRRPVAYDRRSNDYGRRPPSFDDKYPPTFGDRRSTDDRRPPPLDERRPLPGEERRPSDYGRRASSREDRSDTASAQDRPREPHLENAKRVGLPPDLKTPVPTPLPIALGASAASSTRPDPLADRVTIDGRCSTPAGISRPVLMTGSDQLPPSRSAIPLEERISSAPSLHERISGAPPLVPRLEPARPGPSLQERLSKPVENIGITSASAMNASRSTENPPYPRPSDSSRPADSRLALNGDRNRFSLPLDDRTRTAPANYTRPPSVEPRGLLPQPLQPPPPLTSTPSTVTTTHPPLRSRDPSRERTSPNFRPYFRSEFSRPSEDERRLDAHSLPQNENFRRYDDRGRWSPQSHNERRGYREYYDRDRVHWDGKDRDRDRPPPPTNWDRDRDRYPDPSYTGSDRRFEDRDRDRERWYPSYEDPPRRLVDTFSPRGRPRSPSLSREHGELRPPTKRPRDDAYMTSATAAADYYLPPGVPSSKAPQPSLPMPRAASPPRYDRPPLEPTYGGTYGGYERDRVSAGPGYIRDGSTR